MAQERPMPWKWEELVKSGVSAKARATGFANRWNAWCEMILRFLLKAS